MTAAPSRSDLERLSTSALQALITDAVSVLTARAGACTGSDAPPSAFQPQARGRDDDAAPTFILGATSAAASVPGTASGTGLFGSSGSGLFGSTSSSLFGGTASGSLFGGSGAGLFSAASSGGLFSAGPATGGLFLFGSSSGGVAAASGAVVAEAEADDDEYEEVEVTEVTGWKPSVSLEVKDEVATGEEEEEQIYAQRSKLYRWKDEEWKERGVGEARLLRNREGAVRFLMRQEKTGKVVANHMLVDQAPYCDLRPNASSEKIWVWNAQDYSDDEVKTEQFALKFASPELAADFKIAFDAAKLRDKQQG